MRPISRLSLPERVAEHLREGIHQGRWSDPLPGLPRLAEELDVARHTIRRARQLLEAQGVLGRRGLGRSRGIATESAAGAFRRPLRVAILRYDARLADCPQTSRATSLRSGIAALCTSPAQCTANRRRA
jgi:DNA-binding FadR family transcriptional regulator